ncbi:PerC family transcriptional regulator, partial [Klebsiella oxytoca]|nr:PerC family transcriptional regulator [Klebsiella oxytoca]
MVKDSKAESLEAKGLHRRAAAQWMQVLGNGPNLLIVFYVQIMPDDFIMQLHR